MGRAKLNMELISKEKSRNVTFKKRKEGLFRKMHEFTTLCGVSACMIIYGPKSGSNNNNEPETWPENDMEEVHRVIEIYKSKKKDSGNKTFQLSDFFHDRKRKIEDELSKLRKKNMESKYPTWLQDMSLLSEEELRAFGAALSVKYENVRSRIEAIRRNRDGLINVSNFMDFARMSNQSHHGAFYSPHGMRGGVELEFTNQPMHVPMYNSNTTLGIDHHYHQELHRQNSMMMLMNDEFGGGGPGGANVSFKTHVYYESTSAAGRGLVDPMQSACHSPRPLARYYAPPYMAVAPPQLQLPAMEGGYVGGDENHVVQYQMKNNMGKLF